MSVGRPGSYRGQTVTSKDAAKAAKDEEKNVFSLIESYKSQGAELARLTTLRQKALELGITSTTKDALTPQQKVLAAQAAIFDQTSAAQGDFARTSGGLANQQRILGAQVENLKARLGQALLNLLDNAVKFSAQRDVAHQHTLQAGFGAVRAGHLEHDAGPQRHAGGFAPLL